MTKETFALHIADVSAFARSLVASLAERHTDKPAPPGQVEVLNLIARTQGQRNWPALRQVLRQSPAAPPAAAQSLLAGSADGSSADPVASTEVEPPASILSDNARKALAQFDKQGRLMRWPVKFSVQKLVMWVLWTRFDAKRSYTESEVNAVLKAAHMFFDHATLRRELIDHQLMTRKPDCSDYRKLPVRPDGEARALLGAYRARYRQS